MTLSAAEQYLLELINRARLDPKAEAARFGIDLNADLAPGTLNGSAKQVLAPNAHLSQSATLHTEWMLANDIFSHTGVNGTNPGQRIAAQGYSAGTWGENIAWSGTTGSITVESAIADLDRGLFLSEGHRLNMLNGDFREFGAGAAAGPFDANGTTWNAAMLTEDFATSGSAHFLTGVAYTDANHDHFYSMGEGRSGVHISTATTASAGGYALALGSSVTAISGQVGTRAFTLSVDMAPGNVKLDVVNANTFYTSGSLTLGSGITNARLLGVAALDLTGSAAANTLTGNSGANHLRGLGGVDSLAGGKGADRLSGGAGADTFVFARHGGADTVTDFSIAALDTLRLDHHLWLGTQTAAEVVTHFAHIAASEVVLDFGHGDLIHLLGLTSLVGLAAQIDIL